MEVYVDDESKLTLHGLVQHFIMLTETEKNRKLCDVLDALDFNQVTTFICVFYTDTRPGGDLRQISDKSQGIE